MDDPTIGFIGAGSLGTALALGLSSSGYRVAAVNSRGNSSAAEVAARIPGCEAVRGPQHVADVCQLVFIATPDAAISEIATCVTWHRGQGVVHCSGVRPLGILEPAAVMGANTGSFHPFQTFACVSSPKEATNRLKGITFSVEGHGWVLSFLQTVASRLWSRAIRLSPEDRAIYHASAVMSCGLLVALLKAAGDLWQQMGVPQEEALATILPPGEERAGKPFPGGGRRQRNRPTCAGGYGDGAPAPRSHGKQAAQADTPLLRPILGISALGTKENGQAEPGSYGGDAERLPAQVRFSAPRVGIQHWHLSKLIWWRYNHGPQDDHNRHRRHESQR